MVALLTKPLWFETLRRKQQVWFTEFPTQARFQNYCYYLSPYTFFKVVSNVLFFIVGTRKTHPSFHFFISQVGRRMVSSLSGCEDGMIRVHGCMMPINAVRVARRGGTELWDLFWTGVLNSEPMLWHPTPVFLPGESHGQRSVAGCSPWGCKSAGHDLLIKQHVKKRNETHPKVEIRRVVLNMASTLVFFLNECCSD